MVQRSMRWLFGLGLAGALAAGCGPSKRTIRIPESVVPNPKSREAQRQVMPPYVVKMSDGKRVFVAEIPVSHATGECLQHLPLLAAQVRAKIRQTAKMNKTASAECMFVSSSSFPHAAPFQET